VFLNSTGSAEHFGKELIIQIRIISGIPGNIKDSVLQQIEILNTFAAAVRKDLFMIP